MTVQEFIERHPDSTLNLLTPSGYITLPPEKSKELLQGKPAIGHAGTDEARQPIPAEYLLHQEILQIHPHKTIPNYYGAMTDDNVPVQERKRVETIDLSYCILRDKDFTGYHFDGANFRGAWFEGVNFQNAVFLNCDISEARFARCKMDNTAMVNNNCSVTMFKDCSVTGMSMKNCDMEGAAARGFDFKDIQMDDVTRGSLPQVQARTGAVEEGPSGRIISQKELELMGAKHVLWFHGAGGEKADFSNCRLSGLDMSHMNFNGANFDGAVFENVNLSGTYLCNTIAGGTKFTECDLSGVYAENAQFEFAAFDRCDLRMGTFTNSSLRCVGVTDSNLFGMSVENCCVENSQVQEHADILYHYTTVYLSEEDWIQDRQGEMQGMGGMV